MHLRFTRPVAMAFVLVLTLAASGKQIDSTTPPPSLPAINLTDVLAIPRPPASAEEAKAASRALAASDDPLSRSTGLAINMSASSALSAALITNVAGQGVNLIGDWDGQEDLVAEHSGRVADMLTPGSIVTRAAISEHTIANGFAEDIFYYGDSVGNLYVASMNSLTSVPPAPTVLTINVPTVLNAFGTISSDSQVVITGIAVSPVCDLTSFANVNGAYTTNFTGKIGEIVYVAYMDTGSGLRLTSTGQMVRSGLLAFPVADITSPAATPPGNVSDTGFPVTVGGSFGVAFSIFSNLAGVAVDDDGSVYFQQVDLIGMTGANIVKVSAAGTDQNRSLATSGFLTMTTLNPSNGQYGTSSGPVSQVNKYSNYSGTSTTWGNIAALAAGPGNVLYAAVARSYNSSDDAATQATEGLFANPSGLPPTPSMIISFSDATGLFDSCTNGSGTGILPIGDGIADVAAAGLTLTPGINNFRVFAMGDGPDVRASSGGPVLGNLSNTLKLSFQVDDTIYSGLAVDEEGSVYVVSGGTPAGVGRNPSPSLGEVLAFPDSAPADRRGDYIDLRSSAVPMPPTPANTGNGVSDRFDHIFWQAPLDATTLTPEAISGLSRGFLLYLNRTRTVDNTPTLPNGLPQGDDATSGPVNFDDFDPGRQVGGGDDQTYPFKGDDADGGGTPLAGGFEFMFPQGTLGIVPWNAFYLNSNGSVSFSAGDASNAPDPAAFATGAPKIAGAWADLNPYARAGGFSTASFPVQALGFAGVNHFKVRWINTPRFGTETCGNRNTFSISLFDDGTGLDENATQAVNPANPIGNNSVAFNLAEGPTAFQWQVQALNGLLVAMHPRAPGSGNFAFTYGRMDLIGGPSTPVLTGFSAGGLIFGSPNQQVVNISTSPNPFGFPFGSILSVYEFFNTGNDTGLPNAPVYDLRFEGNDPALTTSTGQPEPNRGIAQFTTLITATLSNHLPFTDDPLIPGVTIIKASHVTDLRGRITALRTRVGLTTSWTDPPTPIAGSTIILARITTELRAALNDVYLAEGLTVPVYTDPTLTPGSTIVKAIHITELRNAVGALE